MGLFRAGGYDEQLPQPGLTELLVRLNRKGKTGSVFLDMREGFFESLDTSTASMMEHENTVEHEKKNNKGNKKKGYDG